MHPHNHLNLDILPVFWNSAGAREDEPFFRLSEVRVRISKFLKAILRAYPTQVPKEGSKPKGTVQGYERYSLAQPVLHLQCFRLRDTKLSRFPIDRHGTDALDLELTASCR